MAIKDLPTGYFLDGTSGEGLEFDFGYPSHPRLNVDIEGALGEWNNFTHFTVNLSGIRWIIGMEEILVEIGKPIHPQDLKDELAVCQPIHFRYIGNDERLKEAVRAHCIATWPGLRHVLGLPPIEEVSLP